MLCCVVLFFRKDKSEKLETGGQRVGGEYE